ncbi:MAG: sigma factor-like helix-turn-helix DNA-binding protein, partial [Blastocatellia bacterium]
VYTAAWRNAAAYDEDQGTPLTWLLSIARDKAMARFNSLTHVTATEAPLESEPFIGQPMLLDEPASLLPEHFENAGLALETMPTQEREVLEIAYYEGLSAGDIAGRLGRPPEEVKKQIRKAMTNLLRPVSAVKGPSK